MAIADRMETSLSRVPVLTPEEVGEEGAKFSEVYEKHQVVLLKGYGSACDVSGVGKRFGLKDLDDLRRAYPDAVAKTWGVENGPETLQPDLLSAAARGGSAVSERSNDPGEGEGVFSPDSCKNCTRWYTSFLVQQDGAFEQLRAKIPMPEPPVLAAVHAHHTPCIWVFVCHNTTTGAPPPLDANAVGGRDSNDNGECVHAEPFRGRVEHIDAVEHSGTWHLQVSGTKTWKIRPNSGGDWAAVRYSCSGSSGSPDKSTRPHAPPTLKPGLSHLTVRVEAGDVLVINTRLWFHQTHIDDTAAATEQVSFSYARDFYLPEALQAKGATTNGLDGSVASDMLGSGDGKNEAPDLVPSEMTNVEGTYATHALKPGEVVLSEEPVAALVNHQYCSQNGYVACATCLQSFVVATPTVFVGLLLGKLNRADILRQQRAALMQQAGISEVHRDQLSRLPLHISFCNTECLERSVPIFVCQGKLIVEKYWPKWASLMQLHFIL